MLDAAGRVLVLETKLARSTDRRKVVAQAIDYAAQLTRYGPQAFLDRARERAGADFSEDWFSSREERESFMRNLESNLREGRLSLLIVMDEADQRLKDSVRFLNRATHFSCLLAEVRVARVSGRDVVTVDVYGDESVEEKAVSDSRARPSGPPLAYEGFVSAKREEGLGAEGEAFVSALVWAEKQGAVVTFTAKKCVLGPNQHDGLFWSTETGKLTVWVPAEIHAAMKDHFEKLTGPWKSRMETRTLAPGRGSGIVAEFDAKGATEPEFRELVGHYVRGRGSGNQWK